MTGKTEKILVVFPPDVPAGKYLDVLSSVGAQYEGTAVQCRTSAPDNIMQEATWWQDVSSKVGVAFSILRWQPKAIVVASTMALSGRAFGATYDAQRSLEWLRLLPKRENYLHFAVPKLAWGN